VGGDILTGIMREDQYRGKMIVTKIDGSLQTIEQDNWHDLKEVGECPSPPVISLIKPKPAQSRGFMKGAPSAYISSQTPPLVTPQQ